MWFLRFQLKVSDKAVDGIGVKKRLLTLGNGQNLGKARMSLLGFFPWAVTEESWFASHPVNIKGYSLKIWTRLANQNTTFSSTQSKRGSLRPLTISGSSALNLPSVYYTQSAPRLIDSFKATGVTYRFKRLLYFNHLFKSQTLNVQSCQMEFHSNRKFNFRSTFALAFGHI